MLCGAGEGPNRIVGRPGHAGGALHDRRGVVDLRLDRLHGITELARGRGHGLDVGRGLASGGSGLDGLLAGGVRDRGKGLRRVGQFARHPVRVGERGGEGGTEGFYLGLDALPPVDLLRMGLVLGGHQREILIGAGLQARLHDG